METLIPADTIARRVRELGAEISRDFADRTPLMVVGVLHGSVVLVADLMRTITIPLQLGFVRASSYRGAVTAPSELKTELQDLPDLGGRHLLLVDDIFDTGRTLTRLCAELEQAQPASIRTAVLLWKTSRREVDRVPDYYGFQIPDRFVVGYGLDYNDDYRHLPDIRVVV